MEFPPVNYLALKVIRSNSLPDSFCHSLSNLHVDGKILDIDDSSARILLRRKLRRTVTHGRIYVGFVLQDGDQISTDDGQVQVVHIRLESTTGESWEDTIDPGFRALQHLSGNSSADGLDVSSHLLFAKNAEFAVSVTHRSSKATCLSEMLADESFDVNEEIVRGIFLDILKGIKSLHGMGICHRNINLETIVVFKEQPPKAVLSNLESCRLMTDAYRPVNEIPQCVPPEVWKGVGSTIRNGAELDLWAAGVVLSVLLLKKPLFQTPLSTDQSFYAVLHATNKDDTRFPISNEAIELLHSVLAEEPEDRLALAQIMEHNWFHQAL